jgi:DNA segregation ATPase FtsK/SpoIIIE-like protein
VDGILAGECYCEVMEHDETNNEDRRRLLIRRFVRIGEALEDLHAEIADAISEYYAEYDDAALLSEMDRDERSPLSAQMIQRRFGLGYTRAAHLRDRWKDEHPGREHADTADEDEDDKYKEAEELVIKAQRASTAFLQRRLGFGYARAARLIDTLEKRGVIGPAIGTKPRQVLIKPGKTPTVSKEA